VLTACCSVKLAFPGVIHCYTLFLSSFNVSTILCFICTILYMCLQSFQQYNATVINCSLYCIPLLCYCQYTAKILLLRHINLIIRNSILNILPYLRKGRQGINIPYSCTWHYEIWVQFSCWKDLDLMHNANLHWRFQLSAMLCNSFMYFSAFRRFEQPSSSG
jgi:hypothetical protein